MKPTHIALLTLLTLTLCACSSSENDEEQGVFLSKSLLVATAKSLTFDDGKAETTFVVNGRNIGSWTIKNHGSWVAVSPREGAGSDTVTVSVTQNTTGFERTDTLTLYGGGLTQTITVAQRGPADELTVVPSTISFYAEGGQQNLYIGCKQGWTIERLPQWCRASQQTGKGSTTIKLTATTNDTDTARTGVLVVKGSSEKKEIPITQAVGEPPVVNNFSITGARSFTFSIKATPATTEYGICFSQTTAEPTTADSTHAVAATVADKTVSGRATEMAKATTYYVRAYAKNAVGTAYSPNVVKLATESETTGDDEGATPGTDDNIPPTAARHL